MPTDVPLRTDQMMRLKQRRRDKRRYLKVRPKDGGPWAVMQPHELNSMLDDDDKDTYEIVETWLSLDEYEALAEFTGW